MIEIRDVHKRYGQLEVLKGISASVEKGEVVWRGTPPDPLADASIQETYLSV